MKSGNSLCIIQYIVKSPRLFHDASLSSGTDEIRAECLASLLLFKRRNEDLNKFLTQCDTYPAFVFNTVYAYHLIHLSRVLLLFWLELDLINFHVQGN